MKRRKLVFTVILPVIVLSMFAGVVISYELRQPPLDKLRKAHESLESARRVSAERWAADQFQKAERDLAAGRKAVSEVNSSWWPFGSYRMADSLLGESIRLSTLALALATDRQDSRKKSVDLQVAALNDSLDVWRDMLDYSLPRAEDELLYRAASFSVQMAESLLQKNRHENAREYADSARTVFATLAKRYQQHIDASRQWVRKSEEWSSRAVEKSRTSGQAVVIVDKSKHRLFLLVGGRVIDSTHCELGYNSGHQKRTSGDGATPEGMYRVVKVNNHSKYYRALLLDYPNSEDRIRFESNLSAGVIPPDSKIGGLIEIHGHGGKGRDWTDGCVAVTNGEMDKLLKVVSTGALVTIVREWGNR